MNWATRKAYYSICSGMMNSMLTNIEWQKGKGKGKVVPVL
jgi:hypothetical protein